jgi:SAM-dependent methyltransferase
MTQNWKDIWNRRAQGSEEASLESLIKLDGFDTGAGRMEADDWRKYAALIAEKLCIRDGTTVFEVGCGAGAFLYALRERHSLSVGGIDYSASLIAAASRIIIDGDFRVAEAKEFQTRPQYDHVIANSVFHYFDLEYAAEVLGRMMKKARIAVAVMDIPDLCTKDKSEELRREYLSPHEYEVKYAGLEHTYYARDWFKAQAEVHGHECQVFDGCLPGYAQNRFRFGCIIRISGDFGGGPERTPE